MTTNAYIHNDTIYNAYGQVMSGYTAAQCVTQGGQRGDSTSLSHSVFLPAARRENGSPLGSHFANQCAT